VAFVVRYKNYILKHKILGFGAIMKLALILEAKLDRPWLEKQLGRGNPTVEKIIDTDPSDGAFYKWLTQLYKTHGTDDFLKPQLKQDLEEWINSFQAIKNAGLSSDLNNKDLDYFQETLEKTREYKATQASRKRLSGVHYLGKEYHGAKVLLDDGTFKLFKVEGTSPEAVNALAKLGIGTAWCTRIGADKEMGSSYLAKSPQYVLYKNRKPLYQFDDYSFKDVDNENCTISIDAIRALASNGKFVDDVINSPYNKKLGELCEIIEAFSDLDDMSPLEMSELASEYTGRWLEAEPHIIKHPVAAALYAKYNIKGSWPEAEASIMSDSKAAEIYAKMLPRLRECVSTFTVGGQDRQVKIIWKEYRRDRDNVKVVSYEFVDGLPPVQLDLEEVEFEAIQNSTHYSRWDQVS